MFKILAPPRYGFFQLLHFRENDNVPKSIENLKQTSFSQEDIIRNRIAYVTLPDLDLSYPNEMLIDVIHYELSAFNVQVAHGILVVNIFSNRSNVALETNLVSTDNYLRTIDVKLSRELLIITFTITVSLVLVVCLLVIIRTCACRKHHHHSCPHQGTIKSLPPNLNETNRQYSSTSLRQTDCSSHSGSEQNSGSALASGQVNNFHHHHQQYELPKISPENVKKSRSINRTIFDEIINCSSDLMQNKMDPNGKFSDKSEKDISPLPPPSLYFINDTTLEDRPVWNNETQKYENNEKHFMKYPFEKEQVNRSSGDGESHSNPSPNSSSTTQINYKCKPYEQLSHLENYLNKSEQFSRNKAFSTLNKMHQLKPPHLQIRNQYWI